MGERRKESLLSCRKGEGGDKAMTAGTFDYLLWSCNKKLILISIKFIRLILFTLFSFDIFKKYTFKYL